MPIATNIIVTTKNGNKTKSTNITYANPEAADSSLATFAASLFSLSNSELVSLNRVNKTDLEIPATPAATPYLHLTIDGITDDFEEASLFFSLYGGDNLTLTIDTNLSDTPALSGVVTLSYNGAIDNTGTIPTTFTNNSCTITASAIASALGIPTNDMGSVDFTLTVGELSRTFSADFDLQPM